MKNRLSKLFSGLSHFRSLILLAFLWAPSAGAHGFGQRYDLPVPLWLYLLGAGAAVLLSFVAVGISLRPFAVGLLRNEHISFSLMALIILLLATITFDGFTATPLWASIQYTL